MRRREHEKTNFIIGTYDLYGADPDAHHSVGGGYDGTLHW